MQEIDSYDLQKVKGLLKMVLNKKQILTRIKEAGLCQVFRTLPVATRPVPERTEADIFDGVLSVLWCADRDSVLWGYVLSSVWPSRLLSSIWVGGCCMRVWPFVENVVVCVLVPIRTISIFIERLVTAQAIQNTDILFSYHFTGYFGLIGVVSLIKLVRLWFFFTVTSDIVMMMRLLIKTEKLAKISKKKNTTAQF